MALNPHLEKFLGDKKSEADQGQRDRLHERIDRDFVHHPPKGDQAERYQSLRDDARVMAHEAEELDT